MYKYIYVSMKVHTEVLSKDKTIIIIDINFTFSYIENYDLSVCLSENLSSNS